MVRSVPSASAAPPARRVRVCALDELTTDDFTIVTVDRREIGLIRRTNGVHAVRNRCPHMGAPICKGEVTGTMLAAGRPGDYEFALEGGVLRCPWHKWEFRLDDGTPLLDGDDVRLQIYDVAVEGNDVFLVLGSQ